MQLMADRTSHRFVWFLGLVLIIARGLQIKAKDISIHQHTCDSDENEEGFCDTIDEIKYVQNDEIVNLKEEIPRIQKTEQVESLSQDLKEGQQSNEVHNNLSESNDKQVLSNSNTTTEWIGLQIPVVDGIKVGHIQEIEILPGIKRQMKTLSMRPLVFEISDFLDEDECELIIAMAENKKLSDNPKKTDNRGVYYEDPLNTFKQWDLNGDEYIDSEEIVLIPGKMDLKFTKHNATEMMKTLNLDEDDNGKINLTEFKSVELEEIRQYIAGLLNASSLRRIPNSRVSWLWHDEDELLRYQPDLLHGFHERLQAVTKIPKEIIQESEPMQVMQFEENNYQYCQQDSEPKFEGVPCCLYGDMKECRICRYITLAYFLNDVDEGGELVMPLANSEFEDDIMNNSGTWTGFFTYDKTTGSRNTFEVDVQFKMDGANKVIYGKGSDDSGEFELIDSLLTGNIIRFRKKYLNQGNKDFSIKYAGQLKGNTQIDGKWWVPGGEKMRGKFFMRHKGYEKWMNNAIGKCNSHEYCAKGKLVIKPKRGKAVMWYNHVPNDDGTWIGGLDNRMYYGHCDVTKGEKWMATNWINIDGDGEMELRAWKRGINLISDTRKHLNQNILQRMRRAEDNKAPDEIEEELNNDMENTQEWTFESRPKERHVLNAVVSLLESLSEEEMVAVSKKVHEKLQMLCVPLVLNQGGKISLVDGSKAE